jgi:hypothetical protein
MGRIVTCIVVLCIIAAIFSIRKKELDVMVRYDNCKANTSKRNYNRCCIIDADRDQFKRSLLEYVSNNTLTIPKIIHQI